MNNIIIALLILISTFFIKELFREGYYDSSKIDQIPFGNEDHSYDGDLFQSEKIIFNLINGLDTSNEDMKQQLIELLNILQFI
jgi:hypothetical protein